MRLDKFTAHLADSRKEIRKIISDGLISVNGKTVKNAGLAVTDNDIIEFRGERVIYREFIYIMMNKPAGVVSATFDPRQKTVIDLLPKEMKRFEPFPVGRLDIDTEGLLLLTNDGQAAHRLLSPKRKVPKKYIAHIDGVMTEEETERFESGVVLDDGYKTLPAKLCPVQTCEDEAIYEVTISEGKFHQIKRMFAEFGKKVLYLKRVEFASLSLDKSLKNGEFRELSSEETTKLFKIMQ
ncbi:MAG: rRNA pseudouridine synthase [Clostridia bacterium]|nr:rRNA pseudouridine synthase [Clostridia bacterium]